MQILAIKTFKFVATRQSQSQNQMKILQIWVQFFSLEDERNAKRNELRAGKTTCFYSKWLAK